MGLDYRYRLRENVALNNPFILVSTSYTDERSGETKDVVKNIEMFSVMVEKGSVVDLDDSIVPSEAFEPLNDAAKAQCAKYPDSANPRMTLEDALPLHGNPLADPSSYRNEAARGGDAPIYPAGVNSKLKGVGFADIPRQTLKLSTPKGK